MSQESGRSEESSRIMDRLLVSGSRSEGFSPLSLFFFIFSAVDVEVIVSSASSSFLFLFLTLFTRERHQRTPPEREEENYDLTRVTPCKIHGLQRDEG